MKILQFCILIITCQLGWAQNFKDGKYTRTEKQIRQLPIDKELLGTWISTSSDPFYSFTLNNDRTLVWVSDTSTTTKLDSVTWTQPVARWATYGDDFYFIMPGKEKNEWIYLRLGAYFKKRNLLYLSYAFPDAKMLKSVLKNKQSKEMINNKPVSPFIAEMKKK